jgi:hypothetical protein
MAVIIVPVVVSDRHPAATPAAVTAAPGGQGGSTPAAASGNMAASVATQTVAPMTGGVRSQENPSAPGTVVLPAASPAKGQPERQGLQVGVAVVGIGGQVLYRPAKVVVDPASKWGITALGALDAIGLPYSMKPAWPDFVNEICGQTCKGVSGWMYMVNGEVPLHMADKNPIKAGDEVIWWYSESMDQQLPNWDQLASSQH